MCLCLSGAFPFSVGARHSVLPLSLWRRSVFCGVLPLSIGLSAAWIFGSPCIFYLDCLVQSRLLAAPTSRPTVDHGCQIFKVTVTTLPCVCAIMSVLRARLFCLQQGDICTPLVHAVEGTAQS